MTDRYEFSVWAEGYATDAEGNLLDKDGNVIEPDQDQEDVQPEADEKEKP